MLNHINDAKRKDDERLRKEKEAMEDAKRLQKQKEEEEHEKKKILEDTIRSKRILEEKEKAMLKEEEKLNKILRWPREPSQMQNPHRCQCMFAESYSRKRWSRNKGGK